NEFFWAVRSMSTKRIDKGYLIICNIPKLFE
ncbi:unnamed protein product, partial [marine sediment metagenome]